ncbi:phage baseplate assembly protein V [Acinetobacter sichuanensis]|uniref:Phage baseplate assembly protein V n=1 Tax=Acinetobacter sichuanensis TaxID=2136183 RepID=A0A371YQF7_9GAMM|nr:phage baseplate assembly protein V [Acinetobacter sichuanensis]RFC83710.1 phage baseplate assembly protein V [Acinetobacter sichuanensis]
MSLSIHQRLENMIRIGIIKTIHPSKPFLTVTVNLGEITTAKIRYLNLRSGDDQTWNPPSIGEEVIVFSPNGVLEMGVAFGGFNNAEFPAISEDLNKNITIFSDGCMISYDTKEHALEAVLPESGTVTLTATGGVTVNATGGVTLNAMDGGLEVNGDTQINGKIQISENAKIGGTLRSEGDASFAETIIRGRLYADGNIDSLNGDVRAGNTSLKNHTHPGDSGGETGKPK